MIVHWPVSSRDGWAVLTLYDGIDDVSIVDLDRELTGHVRYPLFLLFPAVRHWRIDKAHPLSTYVFVVRTEPDIVMGMRKSRYVSGVLLTPERKLALVTDQELEGMIPKEPVLKVSVGDEVRILSGDWAGLRGMVREVHGGQALVRVPLHSRTRSLYVPVADISPE